MVLNCRNTFRSHICRRIHFAHTSLTHLPQAAALMMSRGRAVMATSLSEPGGLRDGFAAAAALWEPGEWGGAGKAEKGECKARVV